MKTWRKLKNSILNSALLLLLVGFMISSDTAYGRVKVDFMGGYFMINSKNSAQESGSLAGVGIYNLAIRKDFFDAYEFTAGYSLMLSKTVTGDLGYGPDLGVTYFPFSSSAPLYAEGKNIIFISNEFYKPYLFAEFNQRNYQSISSSYAGFSFGAGLEIYSKSKFFYNTKLRMTSLSGPNKASATEIDLFFGLTYAY